MKEAGKQALYPSLGLIILISGEQNVTMLQLFQKGTCKAVNMSPITASAICKTMWAHEADFQKS
jgi:hypothetical protein